MNRRFKFASMAVACALASSSLAVAQSRTTLPAGTVIPVRLEKAMSSKTANAGDRVRAEVGEGPEAAGLPLGTYIEGVVRESIPSRDGKPGVLDIDFRKLVIPGDDAYTIDGTLASLDAKAVKKTESGRLEASGDKSQDRLKWVGIGAGAGLLISTLTKGNSIVNTILGAGAGYLFNELNKPKVGDVNLKEGTKFGIRLERQVGFAANERYRGNDTRINTRRDSDDDKYYRPGNPGNRRDPNRDRDRDIDPDRITTGQDRDINRDTRPDRDPAVTPVKGDIGVLVNDREVRFGSSAKPFQRNEVVYVPLDSFAKATRFQYDYDSASKTVRARRSDVHFTVGSRVVMVNGSRKLMSGKSEMKNGAIYVPSDFLGIALNGSVDWDAGSNTLIVTTNRDNR